MTTIRDANPDAESALEDFYKAVGAAELQPLWTQSKSLMLTEPKPQTLPWLWRWETLRELVTRAGELIAIDRGGDRRVLSLSNPGLAGQPIASSTLWGAVQYLGPHEGAPEHRHSQGAVRFVLEGSGVWTTVDGDACDMGPGDLVLTPSWTFHDHNNGGDEPMIWFDGLDMPMVNMLDAPFFELPEAREFQPVVGHNLSEQRFAAQGASGVVERALPPGEERHSPLLVYRWARTDAELARGLAGSRTGVASIDFASPLTGRAAVPTIGCHMTRLAAGAHSAPMRKTGSSVYVVWRGEGRSVINGVAMDWHEHDMFVSPSWATVEHEASADADLFSVSDRPALEALHLYREETFAEPQAVSARFPG